MTILVPGELITPAGSDSSGWRVTAAFEERVSFGDGEDQFLPAVRMAATDPAGRFQLELPDAADMRLPLTATAATPSGVAAGVQGFATLPETLKIKVQPSAPVPLEPSEDPARGRMERLTGRVIDRTGTGAPSGLLVVVWGVPPGGTDEQAYPVLVARTSGDGYFSDAWPADVLDRAYGVVQGGETVPVPLQNTRLPLSVVLVLEELPAAPVPVHEDDCDCPETPPRAPSPTDLASDSGTYATDLGGGCVDLTVPNRAVEEVTFHAVVRTSEPEIKGSTFAAPVRLPAQLSDRVSALVLERAKVFEGPRLAADADGAEDPGIAALSRRMAATAEPLRLNPAVLARVARDPNRLRPADLLRAENLTFRKEVGDAVDVLARPEPGRVALDAEHEIDWDDTPTTYQATTVAHGHLLTFKQVFRADGYSMGDLLYSLPLAPGQRKRVAVLDWRRDEEAQRSAERRATELLGAQLNHDRDISEVIATSVRENVRGHSESDLASVGGGIGGFIGPVVFGVGGGYSTGSSSAWQKSARNVAASSLSQMRDRTVQSASAVRSQRATVVQTARQGESLRAQTEVVANHNHCHALTMEYFEVLRHFLMTVELAQVRECLFIPFEITPFGPEKALRNRTVLERFLRRRDLVRGFAAIDRVLTAWRDADFPTGRYADEQIQDVEGELRLAFTLNRPPDTESGGFDSSGWSGYSTFLPQTPGVPAEDLPRHVWRTYLGVALPADRDRIWNTRIAPHIARRIVDTLKLDFMEGTTAVEVTIDPTLVGTFAQGRQMIVAVRPPKGLPVETRAEVTAVRFRFGSVLPPLAAVIAHSAALRYRTAHLSRALFTDWRLDDDLSSTDHVFVPTPLDTYEKRNPRKEDERLGEVLLAHLNDHVEYYHQVLFWTMDPNRRYMLLDGFIAPGTGRSIAGAVENKIIGVVGNCLVMPVVQGLRLDPGYVLNGGGDLTDAYAVPPSAPVRISVPTPGVFAEAVMGACNSCEVKDDTRFWRWEESPIPGEPPAILPLSTATRRTAPPSVAPDEFPGPLVRFQAVPSAPDPTGLAGALNLVGASNLFRDLTGLDLTQAGVAEAFASTMETAKFFGGQAATLAKQGFMAKETERNLARIKQAKDKGLITEKDAQELAEATLSGATGTKTTESKTQRPTASPEVQKVIDRAAGSAASRVKVSRPSGTVEVRSGDAADGAGGLNFAVTPAVVPVAQTGESTCWAAAAAMLLAWRDGRSYTSQQAAQAAGDEWLERFQAGRALDVAEVRSLAEVLGLKAEGPQSFMPRGILRLLQAHGPLWVLGDDAYVGNRLTHVRIATGIHGDGSPDGTLVGVADPDGGLVREETFAVFEAHIEASDVVNTGLGILHW
ncbi:MAG: hypothetical protein GEV11_12125 [Streptosporangiales bacterium]|nr:hypothetical protein [Streptosporangiales bacterium]